MPASLLTVDAITKEIYQGKIRDQLQDEAVGFKRIEQTSEGVESQVGGKYVTFPLRVRRNHGMGYRNENELLPAAGQQGYASVRIGLKYGYGRVRLSGQTIELASSNYQAFANAMEMEMTGLKNDLKKDTNRIFYGDGKGTLATHVSTATPVASNTFIVNSSAFVELGMQVDLVVTSSGAVLAADRQVTATTPTTVTISGAAVTAAASTTYSFVRMGSYGREPQGLAALVTSTGVLHNLDPAVEPSWAAIVDANGGVNRALSENLLIANTDKVRVNGGKTSLILYSLGVRRAYFNLLSQQRRYPTTTKFTGGLTGLAFNNGHEIPCVEDVDCPANTIYGLDEDTFKIYRDHDWEWMTRDGGIWKWVTNFDAYEAVLNKYWEIGTNKRNANFVIKDVTEA